MKLLITGGAGFIGSNLVTYMVNKYPEYTIINVDNLSYAGNLEYLKDIEEAKNYHFIQGDICDAALMQQIITDYRMSHIINCAAETHVDRSIDADANDIFFKTNLFGTKTLLDAIIDNENIELFYQISTDEVYGALSLETSEKFTEKTQLKPQNPYSASKAAADLLINAYINTYKIPAVISRCSNNYGPNQYPEKIIPFFIKKLLNGEKVPVYGDGQHVRDWIHVSDHVRAIDTILHHGVASEIYNVGGDGEITNLELTKKILTAMELDESVIEFVTDRKGHDRRYAMSYDKIKKELGWEPQISFEEGLRQTVEHYKSKVIDK